MSVTSVVREMLILRALINIKEIQRTRIQNVTCGKRYTNIIWEDMREVNIEENKYSVTSVVREIMIVAILVNIKE